MIVRFGYVALSTVESHLSSSRMMTVTNFKKISDREAAIRKLERIAEENLQHALKLLIHSYTHDIHIYRFSSKLIPLSGHELVADWNPYDTLTSSFVAIGEYVREKKMRVSFHPDHYTVLSTPRPEVLKTSYADLNHHVSMLEAMGLDKRAKCNIHIGGVYNDKITTMKRFLLQFNELEPRIRERMTLENDDKTFNAQETLEACETLDVPMVLDLHHHAVNDGGDDVVKLWSRIAETWSNERVPPKIHISSPKSESSKRSHADYIHLPDFLPFLRAVAAEGHTPQIDVMIEAKMKDGALFRLMEELVLQQEVERIDGASIRI